ncbi:hypothetical protein XELAEV_18021276mg [Xenopus laevis]|uniref:Uncharacterized protein n=1 Tax=Xenopus laevis TaxID=8355 RepID=A0A974D8P7_XENLA|nr:hypothetical protein XELAEV_18021276mg [Xenopus laevis]
MPTILPKEMKGHFPSVIPGLITSDAVYAWAIKEGVNPQRAVVIDGVHPLAPVYLAAWPFSMFPRFMGYRFIARAPSEIQETVRLLWQVENELPDDGEGPSMIFPHGLPDGCPCVYASLPAQFHKKEKTVITPSAVYLWALLEKVEPCQAVVVDGILECCPPDSVHHALMDNPLFDGLEYVTQGPSMEKGKVRFLYWVPDEPYQETWPSRVYPIGAPAEGCPYVYQDYFTPQNLSEARAAALSNPPSEDEESVRVTESVDRVDYPEESGVPTDVLPPEPEGPVESRESTGQIESTDKGDCSTEEAFATERPCEPESPVVLLLEESPPIIAISLALGDKGDASDVVALPQEESGPSANVSPCLKVDSTITLLTTELCAVNLDNSPAIEVACVNVMPECAPAESDSPGGVSEEVTAVEICTASHSPSIPCSVRVKLGSARKRQRRRVSVEDSTAAILYLASTLLELADAKKQMAEPVAEPEVQVPEENPVPFAPTRVEPEWQYVYQGTFTPSERGMMIPACGVCDMEAPNALEDPDGVCSQCETHLWMGPFNRADQPPLVEKTRDKVSGKTILVYEEIEKAPGVSAAATPTPEPVPEKFPEPALGSAFVPAPEVVPLEGDVPVTAAAVSETISSGWTADVCSTTPSLKPEGLCDVLAAVMPTPLVVSTAVSDAPGGEVCTPSAIGAPVCCVPATEPLPEDCLERAWHAPEVDVACRPDAVLISSEEEYFQHVLNSGTENPLVESQVSKTPMVVPGAAAPHVRSNSSESKSSSRKVLLSDSEPCGDLTVTIYTALAVPTPIPVIGHDVDWRKFSFNRLGLIAPIAPSIRDPPILEDDEDLLDKLMSSSVNSADESILEVPAQIRCQSKSEPGESTQVAELYHYEWGKISLEREKNLLAALPKLKDDNPLGPAPGWEEYEEAPEAEHGPGPPTEVPCSFIAPPIIGPEEEKDFWVLPGRADPNVFTSVSRVQRVINFHVHRKWGYFMPYAPLWVYEKVAASYEKWLIDEILRKEKMHHSCLTNPDKVRREQDWQYLRSIEKEWWYGRTILQNAVKSCGKYNPTKYFNLEVYLGDGQWVDKPHPKYYIPYEDTKARFLHMI